MTWPDSFALRTCDLNAAAENAYFMRDHAHSTEALIAPREDAREAHDRFVNAAAAYLTGA